MQIESIRFAPDLETKAFALRFLEQGRKGFDVPHTLAVVHYSTVIAACQGLSVGVMRTIAWLHDTGYYTQFADSDPSHLQTVIDSKAAHMANGEKLARRFLLQPEINRRFTPEEIDLVCHVIGIHDRVEELASPYEIAFMEADTLGAIDIDRVKPTFNYEDGIAYIQNHLLSRRLPRFRTRAGLILAKAQVPRFINYFRTLKS